MDTNILAGGATGSAIIVIVGLIYKLLNHKKSTCRFCGRSVEVAIDIDDTTPKNVILKKDGIASGCDTQRRQEERPTPGETWI
jgi:hypothetical protein